MINCKEYYLDDARAITAIPVSEPTINEAEPTSPANQLTPTIEAEGFNLTSDAIVIGRYRPVADGVTRDDVAFIPMQPGTGKAKDSESDSVAGRLHTVTVTCEVDDRDGEVWRHLLTLERTPCHLELTFRDGRTRAFVSGNKDSWLCHTERDGRKTTVTMRIQNLMGVQLFVNTWSQ